MTETNDMKTQCWVKLTLFEERRQPHIVYTYALNVLYLLSCAF